MGPPLSFFSTLLFICYYIYGSGSIITNGNKAEGNVQGSKYHPAHLIPISEQPPEQKPARRAESKLDAPGESQLNREHSIERQSLYSSSSHSYPGKWATFFMSLSTRQNLATKCSCLQCLKRSQRVMKTA
jgi:hypothetical protein